MVEYISNVNKSFDCQTGELHQILPPDYPDYSCDKMSGDEEDDQLPGPDGFHQEGGEPGHGDVQEESQEPGGHTEERISIKARYESGKDLCATH